MLYFFKNCSKTVIFETATYLLIFFCVIPSCCPRTFHYIEKIHCLARELRVKFHAKTRDITCARVDMNFIFEWSTRYLTRSLRSLVRYRVQHESIKFISISEYVISSIYYIIIKITISSIVIGLKNSYFPLILLPSCYRTVCYRTACYWTVCYWTVQQTNQIHSCSLNQPITFKVVV